MFQSFLNVSVKMNNFSLGIFYVFNPSLIVDVPKYVLKKYDRQIGRRKILGGRVGDSIFVVYCMYVEICM